MVARVRGVVLVRRQVVHDPPLEIEHRAHRGGALMRLGNLILPGQEHASEVLGFAQHVDGFGVRIALELRGQLTRGVEEDGKRCGMSH